MDFPGHYMRLIKSVVVSIPAVVGPHTNTNATLTLTLKEHKYRVQTGPATADEYLNEDRDHQSFRADRVSISSIAVSSGIRDSGMFELNFHNERFMLFEGAGAISSWRLELPTEVRQFDYESISDVVLHVMYMSLDGGMCLRRAANLAVGKLGTAMAQKGAKEGFCALFDLRNDFSNEWWALKESLALPKMPATMTLGSLQDRLPFWSRRNKLQVKSVTFVFGPERLDLVGKLKLSAVDENAEWTPGAIGSCVSYECDKLSVENLNDWTLSVDEAVTKAPDRVFMILRYIFKQDLKKP